MAAILVAGLTLYLAGSFALRSGDASTRFGTSGGTWPATVRKLDRVENEVGFAVRYAHNLPEGWRLAQIDANPAGRRSATVELRYRNEAQDLYFTLRQWPLPGPFPAPRAGELVVALGDRPGVLRRQAGGTIVVGWRDRREVWIEARSRLSANWDIDALLWTLTSVH